MFKYVLIALMLGVSTTKAQTLDELIQGNKPRMNSEESARFNYAKTIVGNCGSWDASCQMTQRIASMTPQQREEAMYRGESAPQYTASSPAMRVWNEVWDSFLHPQPRIRCSSRRIGHTIYINCN